MLVVIDHFLDINEVAAYQRALDGATWQDGLASAGGLNVRAKRNEQTDPETEVVRKLANGLLRKMGHHPLFVSACLPHKIFPPVFNRYGVGQEYDVHVDAAIMQGPAPGDVMRSDVSMTVFLSELEEYDGGELVIEGQFGAQEVRLNAGDAVLYPSGSLHRVNAVTRGERLAAITWVQSMVAEVEARSLLFEMDQAIQALTNSRSSPEQLVRLTSVYHNLMRRMASV